MKKKKKLSKIIKKNARKKAIKDFKKKIKRFYKKKKKLCIVFGVAFCIIFIAALIRLYTLHLNRAVSRLENMTDSVYIKEDYIKGSNGFNTVNLHGDLKEYFKTNLNNSVAYKFKDETFFVDITKISNEKKKEPTFDVDKIVDKERNINARVNFQNVVALEFKTGGDRSATVIHLLSTNDDAYYVITGNTYYSLGDDIENISFLEGEFYYVYYNNKYKAIDTAGGCTEELMLSIDEFNQNDIYYHYGRINFLPEYYQKLASKSLTVKDKCDSMEQSNSNAE